MKRRFMAIILVVVVSFFVGYLSLTGNAEGFPRKLGSMTMANIAAYGGRVFSKAPTFGNRAEGLQGVTAMQGLMQISARGFAVDEPAQAAQSAAMFLQFLGRRRGKIEKQMGVKLGREDEAWAWLERAAQWTEEHAPDDERLDRLLEQAAALLEGNEQGAPQ